MDCYRNPNLKNTNEDSFEEKMGQIEEESDDQVDPAQVVQLFVLQPDKLSVRLDVLLQPIVVHEFFFFHKWARLRRVAAAMTLVFASMYS